MGAVDHQLLELARPGLAPGETPVASLRVNYNGTTAANTFTIESGLAALGGTPEGDPDPNKLIAFPVASQMALLVTSTRVLVWQTGMRGKPKGYLGDVRLGGVESVNAAAGRLGQHIEFVMKSGARVDLEAVRGEDPGAFVDAVTAALDGSRSG